MGVSLIVLEQRAEIRSLSSLEQDKLSEAGRKVSLICVLGKQDSSRLSIPLQ